MCGIVGVFDPSHEKPASVEDLIAMATRIAHRGPDSYGYFTDRGAGFGFRRLSIIDLATGDQPMHNESQSVVSVCNGELYNYRELKSKLEQKGHQFRTNCDVEVLPHLYEEYGIGLLDHLNGQFAFAIFDKARNILFLARDQFGVNPLFYTISQDRFVFSSEIKGILEYPGVRRKVNLTGIDQIFSLPGLASPTTMFEGIYSLKSGHYIAVSTSGVEIKEYWEINYPRLDEMESSAKDEAFYVDALTELLQRSISRRLQADVPVGVYLSGGLDSSLVASMASQLSPDVQRHSFSISFQKQEMCEGRHQNKMSKVIGSQHHDIPFDGTGIAKGLETAVYHAECPLKETYDTACLELSRKAKATGVPVVLTGQGADELFAGYIGYRFDKFSHEQQRNADEEELQERKLREELWGDPLLVYDTNYSALRRLKTDIYSGHVLEQFDSFDCFKTLPINRNYLDGRHYVHKRSYLDLKLRLADHLLGDHGDRMSMANSVEIRHPFLDIEIAGFAAQLPPHFKLHGFDEKYVVKQAARRFVPHEIVDREKFGWFAPGSPALLRSHPEWIEERLSAERVKKEGYFNPSFIEKLKHRYKHPDFALNQPFESDLLMIALTFSMFLEIFNMPALN